MDFDHYRVFYYVGKYKSVTLAAQELFTSQPAVTRTIKTLEHELSCRLFIRSKKGMELTHEGEVLFEYVSASFNQLEKGESEIRRNTSTKEGSITIGATVTALDEFLFSFIKEFHINNPYIKFRIVSESTNNTLNKLRTGVIDVALITTPYHTFEDVEYIKVGKFKNVIVAGNEFQDLKNRIISVSELHNYPFIAMNQKTQLREYTDSFFLTHSIPISPTVQVDNAGLIIPFVRNNLGVAIVPYSLAKGSINRDEMFVIKTKEEIPDRYVYMVISKALPLSNATKTFVKEVKEKNKKESPE